jgi:hypothetical protein
MDQEKRLTPERVRAALDALGATLRPGVTWNPRLRCGCPIGVVAVAEKPELAEVEMDSAYEPSEFLGLTPHYRRGLVDGFDKVPYCLSYGAALADSADYALGLADGRGLRLLLPSEGEVAS